MPVDAAWRGEASGRQSQGHSRPPSEGQRSGRRPPTSQRGGRAGGGRDGARGAVNRQRRQRGGGGGGGRGAEAGGPDQWGEPAWQPPPGSPPPPSPTTAPARQATPLFQGGGGGGAAAAGAGALGGAAAAAAPSPPQLLTARICAAPDWRTLAALLASERRRGALNPIHLASLAHTVSRTTRGGLARVEPPGERRQLQDLLDDLVALSVASLNQHGPQELATILGALARLGYRHRQYVACVEEATLQLLHRCSPRELSVLGWAMARLGHTPCPAWVDAFTSTTGACLHTLNHVELSHVLWALARFEAPPPPPWLEAYWAALRVAVPDMHPPGLVSVLWSAAMLKLAPPGDVLDALLLESQVRFGSFDGHGLTTLAWSVARMDLRPRALWREDFVRHAQRSIPVLSKDQAFTNLVWALANWDHRPPDPWLQQLCRAATPYLPAMGPGGMAILAASLAALRPAPPWEWVAFLLEEFHRQKGAATASQACVLVWALPRLLRPAAADASWRPPPLWTAPHARHLLELGDVIAEGVGKVEAADLADAVVGFADLGVFPGVGWMDAHERATNARLAELSAEQVAQVRSAYARLDALCSAQAAAAASRGGDGGDDGGGGGVRGAWEGQEEARAEAPPPPRARRRGG